MKLQLPRSTTLLALATVLSGSLLLTACGGGGGSAAPAGGTTALLPVAPVSLAGVVADGLIQGATVCYDLNDNGRCDAGEPVSSSTGINGAYTLSVPASEAGKHAVIAIVPVGAIDADTGPVTTAYSLKSPANTNTAASIFVSPITTIVQEVLQSTGSGDIAAAVELVKQQLGMNISPLSNFIELRATDSDAARAGSIAQVITALKQEISSTAVSAGVSAADTQALLSVVVVNNLTNLASSVANQGTKTAVQAAQQLAQSQGITSSTVAIQAQIASSISSATTDTVTTTSGPFLTLRDFRYTNSTNWNYRVFVGDNVVQSDGFKRSTDIRKQATGSYTRNASFYDEAAAKWYECPSDGYEAIVYKDVTATTPGESLFCRTYRDTSRRTTESIAGQSIANVIDRVRSSGLDGYSTWAGATSTLASPSATFPAGSELRYQVNTTVATPFGHNLTDKVRVYKNTTLTSFGQWPFANSLDEMIAFYPGNFNSAAINGSNTDGLGEIPDASYVAANMQSLKNFRVAFQATSATAGNARFWICRRNATPNTNTNCTVGTTQLFDTTYTIETLADARVLKFARLPEEIQGFRKFARVYVERAGAVFYGFKDNLAVNTTVRLNETAWTAMRAQFSGVTTHTVPTAPAAVDAATWLRDMRRDLLGADAFNVRLIKSQVTNTTTGSGVFSEVRKNVTGGVHQPFSRNALYLVGGTWKTSDGANNQCPSNGVDVGTFTSNPRASVFCNVFNDSSTGFDADISGRTYNAVITDMTQFGSFDNGRDASNYGPSVLSTDPEYATWTTSVFPAGSRLRYQVVTTSSSVDSINLSSVVRSGSPSVTVTSLASLTTTYSGGFSNTANGGNTIGLHQYRSNATPGVGYTGVKRIRLSFQSGTNNASFWSCDVLTSNGNTDNCQSLLATTYSISTIDGIDILRLASFPAIVTNQIGTHTFFAQQNSAVYFGGITPIGYKSYTLRLNQTAYEAMFGIFGFTMPTQTCTVGPCP